MLWPMVLPPYHSLREKNEVLLFRDKELSWTFQSRTQMRQDPMEAHPTAPDSSSLLTWALALAHSTVISGKGFHPCPLKCFMPRHPWTIVVLRHFHSALGKSQGIPTLPVVCLGHEGEDWASYSPSESQTFPVSGEVNTACPHTTHLEGCNETLWKDMCGSALKTLEAVGMFFQIPQLLSKKDVTEFLRN